MWNYYYCYYNFYSSDKHSNIFHARDALIYALFSSTIFFYYRSAFVTRCPKHPCVRAPVGICLYRQLYYTLCTVNGVVCVKIFVARIL